MPRRLAQQRMTLSDLEYLKSTSSASRAISVVAKLLVCICYGKIVAETTMAFNGYKASFINYDRTFLPQLPKNVKNRNMEESRLAMQTSSQEYGKFLVRDDVNVDGRSTANALTPIYVTRPTPAVIAAASRRPRPLPVFPYVSTFKVAVTYRYRSLTRLIVSSVYWVTVRR